MSTTTRKYGRFTVMEGAETAMKSSPNHLWPVCCKFTHTGHNGLFHPSDCVSWVYTVYGVDSYLHSRYQHRHHPFGNSRF